MITVLQSAIICSISRSSRVLGIFLSWFRSISVVPTDLRAASKMCMGRLLTSCSVGRSMGLPV